MLTAEGIEPAIAVQILCSSPGKPAVVLRDEYLRSRQNQHAAARRLLPAPAAVGGLQLPAVGAAGPDGDAAAPPQPDADEVQLLREENERDAVEEDPLELDARWEDWETVNGKNEVGLFQGIDQKFLAKGRTFTLGLHAGILCRTAET